MVLLLLLEVVPHPFACIKVVGRFNKTIHLWNVLVDLLSSLIFNSYNEARVLNSRINLQ